jgi:hypothetical protein
MNCPECGRFMRRVIAFEAGRDVWECAYWWVCEDDAQHARDADPIPAPEYNWLWMAEGIPSKVLLDWPELRREYDEMWLCLPRSIRRQHKHALA